MKSSTKDQVSGGLHEAKGKVKETIGKVVGSDRLKTEGRDEKVSGKVQKKIGQMERVIGK